MENEMDNGMENEMENGMENEMEKRMHVWLLQMRRQQL